jgi:hypothetical protein
MRPRNCGSLALRERATMNTLKSTLLVVGSYVAFAILLPATASAQLPDFIFVAANKAVHRELGFTDVMGSQVRKVASSYSRERDRISRMKMDDLPAEQQEELKKLADDERKVRLTQIKAQLRKANLAKHDAMVQQLLRPEEVDRVRQIRLQLRGSLQFNEPDLVKALDLSEEQRQQIAKLNDEYTATWLRIAQTLEPQPRLVKQTELTIERNEKAVALLTEKQQKKYAELIGQPFDIASFIPMLSL